jgi:hypothetical protein
MDQDRKLKTALDESRLLILGAQVLFGFLFQAVFQDLFRDIPPASQTVQCAGLEFMLLSICLLIAPSLYHQIVFAAESRPGAVTYASRRAGAVILPLTLGLGASVFVYSSICSDEPGAAGNAGCLYGTILGSNRCIGGSRTAGVF